MNTNSIASILQLRIDKENKCDATQTSQRGRKKEKTDSRATSDWEQYEHTYELNNYRQRVPKLYEKEQLNLITYKKWPSSYCKLDQLTTLIIKKLVDERSLGPHHNLIGKGKNSIIISAGFTDTKHHDMPTYRGSLNNAVKIYKLSNDENLNKAIYKRTKIEFEHMKYLRSRRASIVPAAVCCHKNILVMSMLGTHEEPAQPLASVSTDLKDIYHRVVDFMKFLYYVQLVHGKLCASNILIWQHGIPYFVGWSHSVWIKEPSAPKKIMSDCYNVTKFFKTKKVPVMPTEALFKEVSGFKDISPEVLDVILNKEPRKLKYRGNIIMESNSPVRNCRFK